MAVTRAVPKLNLAVACSYIEFDGNNRPFKLVEPRFVLRVPPRSDGTLPAADFSMYAQLDDENAAGTFWFAVEARDVRGRPVPRPYRTTPLEHTFDPGTYDPLVPTELAFTLTGLVFPVPGAYDLYVMCNHLSLHALDRSPPPCRVRVVPAESEAR